MDFNGVRVLVVGDCMLDEYISGQVLRISPEAPVPIVKKEKQWFAPGGAANVARNLVRLGAKVCLAGLAGDDFAGGVLKKHLHAENIEDSILYGNDYSTICKTRVMSQGQQLLRLDDEHVGPLNDTQAKTLLLVCQKALEECQVLVLSDYAKGIFLDREQNANLATNLIELAHEHEVPVIVDPKGSDWQKYRNADCVTPNSREFHIACGHQVYAPFDRPTRQGNAEKLCSQFGFARILLTRGARGMALFVPGDEPLYIRATEREVADVSGAGDTVIATLAACVAKGLSWAESARIANQAAGVAVGKMGTSPISIAELNQTIGEQAENPKLMELPVLLEKIEDWRRKNESIVFTNGCFDLLHPGHISLIRQCVMQGDHLVIGLNTDNSVRRLKGSTRPIQNEQSRALLLAALRGVDAVILFDEDTPLDLIRQVRPDVLVKGSDYTLATVVGAEDVQAYGGRVYLANLVDGCSTSSLVRRMAG